LLLELDITLVLYERGLPWHILLLFRQFCIELAMCGTVKSTSVELAVSVALICIKESGKPDMSETVHAELLFF
jgi:hypothetical protein